MVKRCNNYTMAMNIKNSGVEELATEVAGLAHETKTEAIRQALIKRRTRLHARSGTVGSRKNLHDYLERNVWSIIPPNKLGRVISRKQEDQILGYCPDGF